METSQESLVDTVPDKAAQTDHQGRVENLNLILEDEGDRAAVNLELRNLHLDKADKALGQRNRINRKIKIGIPEKTGRLAEESNELFEIFADKLMQACGSCALRGDCALAFNPVAWEKSKHYARSPDNAWGDTVSDDGVKNESRERWRKRRKNDPEASCVPKKPIERIAA